MCSSICKCIGCKNYEESPERKTLMNLPNYMDIGGFEGGHHLSPTKLSGLPTFRKDRWVLGTNPPKRGTPGESESHLTGKKACLSAVGVGAAGPGEGGLRFV